MKRFLIALICIVTTSNQLFAQLDKIEHALGKNVFNTIVQTQGLYENEELLALVKKVGQKLEEQIEEDYDFKYYLVDVPEPNAFATSGGYVFVTRGLLALINSEDELAGVLAHEFSHVMLHHTTKRIAPAFATAILKLPGNIVGALTNDLVKTLLNLPIDVVSTLATNAYSRSQETSADKHGAILAQKAGYDPYGLVYSLENLDAYISSITDELNKSVLLLDHPHTDHRVKVLEQLFKKEGFEQEKVTKGTDILGLKGLVYGQNPEQGMIKDNAFYHKGLKLYAAFPKSWHVKNTPVSLTAVSKNHKGVVVLSADTSKGSPKEAGEAFLRSVDPALLVSTSNEKVNDLEAYKASFIVKKLKEGDCLTEIMWVKVPESNLLLRVVGVSEATNPIVGISESFNSFRSLTEEDMKQVKVEYVDLVEVTKKKSAKAIIETRNIKDVDTFYLINAIQEKDKVEKGNYLKVISSVSLSDY